MIIDKTKIDKLIPLVDVKQSLAVSWSYLADIIQDGRLEVFDITKTTSHKTHSHRPTWANG